MDFPLHLARKVVNVGADTSTSYGTKLTSGGAYVYGSWVELTASTPIESNAVLLQLGPVSSVTSNFSNGWFQLAIGPSGSEQIITSGKGLLTTGGSTNFFMRQDYYLPLAIPQGVRLAARLAGDNSAAYGRISALLQSVGFGGVPGYQKMVGDQTSLVTVDPGGTANTKGAYTEAVASTSMDYKVLCFGISCQDDSTRVAGGFLVDIAIGASGSEQVIVENHQMTTSGTVDTFFIRNMTIPVDIPKGSRIAVRAQSSITGTGDRTFDCVIHGLG